MMNYLRSSLDGVLLRLGLSNYDNNEQPVHDPEPPVSKLELCLNAVHDIVTWQNGHLTLAVLCGCQAFVYLVALFKLRFFAVLLLLVFVALICHTYCEYVFNTRDPGSFSKSGRQIKEHVIHRITYLRQLRSKNPGAFCSLMCLFFFSFAVFSRHVSFTQLVSLLIFAAFSFSKLKLYLYNLYDEDLLFEDPCEDLGSDNGSTRSSGPEGTDDTGPTASLTSMLNNLEQEELEKCSISSKSSEGHNSLENELTTMPSISDIDSECDFEPDEAEEVDGAKAIVFFPTHFEQQLSQKASDSSLNSCTSEDDEKDALSLVPNSHKRSTRRHPTFSGSSSSSSSGKSSESEFEILDTSELSDFPLS